MFAGRIKYKCRLKLKLLQVELSLFSHFVKHVARDLLIQRKKYLRNAHYNLLNNKPIDVILYEEKHGLINFPLQNMKEDQIRG